jgi:hypothetical protein
MAVPEYARTSVSLELGLIAEHYGSSTDRTRFTAGQWRNLS